MNTNFENGKMPGQPDPNETLRLMATLPPPEGLEQRVHTRLRFRMQEPEPERSFWSLWTPARRLQFAGAAVLAMAVGVLTWGNYHVGGPAKNTSSGPAVPVAAPVVAPAAGGFSTSGAVRQPPTLRPIEVPPVPKKKAAGKRAAKPSAGTRAAIAPQATAPAP